MRLTPINWHLTGDEAGYIVENCEAKAFIAAAELGDRAVEAAAGGATGTPDLLVKLAVGGRARRVRLLRRRHRRARRNRHRGPDSGQPDALHLGNHGSTQRGAPHAAAPSTLAAVNFWGYNEDFPHGVDVHLCTGPLYHAAPLAFSVAAPMLYGVPIVIMKQWDPAETLRLIDQYGITHTHMVPTMFHRMLALPDDVRAKYDLSSLGCRDPWRRAVPGRPSSNG